METGTGAARDARRAPAAAAAAGLLALALCLLLPTPAYADIAGDIRAAPSA